MVKLLTGGLKNRLVLEVQYMLILPYIEFRLNLDDMGVAWRHPQESNTSKHVKTNINNHTKHTTLFPS